MCQAEAEPSAPRAFSVPDEPSLSHGSSLQRSPCVRAVYRLERAFRQTPSPPNHHTTFRETVEAGIIAQHLTGSTKAMGSSAGPWSHRRGWAGAAVLLRNPELLRNKEAGGWMWMEGPETTSERFQKPEASRPASPPVDIHSTRRRISSRRRPPSRHHIPTHRCLDNQ
jgi:hypothetical protein